MLGGKDNFAADREFVAEVLRFAPMAPLGAISNRQFLRRVVQYLVVEAGVTQFIDLGSGLPTQGNVSEVAHQFNPRARVVHVDNDPIVYTHSKALLADAQTTDFVLGDVRRPREILTDPVVESMIDFGQPVGLLLFALLHHVEDSDHPERIMADFRAAMPSGSYLAISSLRLPGPELPELRAVTIEGEKRARRNPRGHAVARGQRDPLLVWRLGTRLAWAGPAWRLAAAGGGPCPLSPRSSTASPAASPGRDAGPRQAEHASVRDKGLEYSERKRLTPRGR